MSFRLGISPVDAQVRILRERVLSAKLAQIPVQTETGLSPEIQNAIAIEVAAAIGTVVLDDEDYSLLPPA